ncbi:hypothetical protein QRY34_08775 [Campylobacter jejuni]|uniref:hypothetical protein n=1 Tax=Campylobacter jejuni TaxID=197 RepID=UPI0011779CC2|nr:hypothetical protein [Campylobacter jejuni]ELL7906966.1 hypothetical protein [Campylobacter jejuni]MEA8936348.1 hypothetical protein [Campylobacter jejuni]MEA8949807.1 hypothetical protein [Campylobacter jejuni]MEA8970530.1 hypothetical protein [Campylobacter jejuni]MEA8972254.1 hypothetical protein [Campylobacter jejuni]
MKKIILGLAVIASLSSVASAKITVSQQPIVQPHYEGCVLVYQYGRDYSKCSNQDIYNDNIDYKLCKLRGQCK